ncbi:CaiB/BaiF CoA-transferase family protein [Pusillimonas sp. ANT_WB101]|uniref:CaiB/BaiF CoA transferase family protein n=1 Tax=Pusillimonas sp. ANT_WB101 TaxID=2597356 RepID=UPI0011ED85F0|nr:CoA transferase [Pusillimonas sp. ANT_WB101]KAA0892536.1 CoA transferase [Pusillimonas sp. ANT_WB101]
MLPLNGVKVLDLSKVLAGPLCAQSLGDLGADVIKIEPPVVGDDARAWTPKYGDESASFLAVNHNKKSLAIDLKAKQGQEIFHRLARNADVIIQGFGSGTARRLGVDYETLKAIVPDVVYCEISGYGRDGPMGSEPGYDVMLQAFSGMISSIGQAGGECARVSFSPVDLGTGMHAVSGILAALLHKKNSGQGSYVEVSLLDTAMGYMGYMAHNYWASGRVPTPMGTSHPSLCPYQTFATLDGSLMLGVGNDRLWQKFCSSADLGPYMADPRFATNAARVKNFAQTCALVEERLRTRGTEEWISILRAAGVPVSPIQTLAEALNHEQVKSRNIVVKSAHATLGEVSHIAYPVTFNKQPRGVKSAAPTLGQHSQEVLLQAGYDQSEIERFLSQGVIAQYEGK